MSRAFDYRPVAAEYRGAAIATALRAQAALDAGDFEAAYLATIEANSLASLADICDARADHDDHHASH